MNDHVDIGGGLAVQYGAVVTKELEEGTTHVVDTGNMASDRLQWAREHSRHAVSVRWLYASGAYLLLPQRAS